MVAEEFFVRNVEERDIKKIFELSNDALVRKNSFSMMEITWEEHQAWFNERLESNLPFYVVETKENDIIAQVRFDKKEDIFISISISNKYRGLHLASKIIKQTSAKTGFKEIYALIKKDNIPSIKAFEGAGYEFLQTDLDFVKMVYK